ncbi:M23 family metallopeptidase [Mycobacterium sp. MBM]|nr:M23 family metallopeptidase [Mycobacterium sp. MBM]
MRVLPVLVVAALVGAAPAAAEAERLQWPLRPPAAVTRGFDAPAQNWQRGHRGVDLAGTPGQTVFAAAAGIVVFAGELAGRPLVSVQHPGGLRTSYEPVRPAVRAGQRVDAGTPLGVLLGGHPGCPVPACLHWGAMWGPAARADYVDPLGLLAATPLVLKPVGGPDRAPPATARR